MALLTIDLITGNPLLLNVNVSGGSFSNQYSSPTPIPVSIGGVENGTIFTNASISDVLNTLFYPYQYPSFISFGISGQNQLIEVGDSIFANRTFVWNTNNNINIQNNTIVIRDVSNSVILANNITNDGSESVIMDAIIKTTSTSHLFRISATNNKLQNFQRDYSVNWLWRRYYGESLNSVLNESEIKLLRVNGLTSSFSTTYPFTTGGFKYITYPSSLGTATVFKDSLTNLDIPFETLYTVNITNSFGISTTYNVHRTTNIINSTIDIIVT